jgi:hypothetical protein
MQYDAILSEQEELFLRTQPTGVNFEKERVTGGDQANPFDAYLIAKERKRIDERLKEIKSILDDRKELLDLKERELRASKDWNDIIFKYYYLDNLSITKIENRIPYSRVQIWRKLNEIKSNLKEV